LFIGSSSEGSTIAKYLQVELQDFCEIVPWYQGVFEPSGYTLESLLNAAARVDFAVLIATPDDTVVSREVEQASPRDNIVLEFGLFAGTLGRERTYLLSTGELKIPTDVLGMTRLAYHHGATNERAAVTAAALQVREQIDRWGPRTRTGSTGGTPRGIALSKELDLLCTNAVTQGWTVKTNNETTLRLISPRGNAFTLSKGPAGATREELRSFVRHLRGAGLRVNNSLRRPVAESPFQD